MSDHQRHPMVRQYCFRGNMMVRWGCALTIGYWTSLQWRTSTLFPSLWTCSINWEMLLDLPSWIWGLDTIKWGLLKRMSQRLLMLPSMAHMSFLWCPSDLPMLRQPFAPLWTRFAKEWQELADLARVCLHKAAKRSKKWVNRKKRDAQFQKGDLVLVKLYLVLRPNGIHKRLVRRYKGPFKVLKRVGKVTYKLELPAKLKVHSVFHMSMLKPFYED